MINIPSLLLKYKKVFLIFGFITISIIIGYLIYFLFFFNMAQKRVPEKKTESNKIISGFPESEKYTRNISTTTKENIPESKEKNIEQSNIKINKKEKLITNLNDAPSLNPVLDQNGSSLKYYNQNDGKFYKINKNGDITVMDDKIFHNVKKVNWYPNNDKAIIEYPDGSNIIYNFKTKKQITLPKHWTDFNFSPDGNNIILKSIGLDPDNRWLITTDKNGDNAKIIEEIGKNQDIVHTKWSPNNQIVAMYTKGIDANRQEVYFLGKNDENFRSMIIEGHDFRPKWSKNGEKLIYSVYSIKDNLKPKLWTVTAIGDKIGTNRKSIDVNTWPEKCTFANEKEIYCGVPINLKDGAGMFPEIADNTMDELYKINIETGKKEKITTLKGGYNISDIIISKDGKNIYFTDKLTKRIHKIEL